MIVVVVFFFSLEVVTSMPVAAKCLLFFSNGFQCSQLH